MEISLKRFGLLNILVTVMVVIFLIVQATIIGVTFTNTVRFTEKSVAGRVETALTFVNRQIRVKIDSAEAIAARVRQGIEAEQINLASSQDFHQQVSAILNGSDYISSIKFLFPQGKSFRVRRGHLYNPFSIGYEKPNFFGRSRGASNAGEWVNFDWVPSLAESVAIFELPVIQHDVEIGVIQIELPISEFSKILKEVGRIHDGQVVITYLDDRDESPVEYVLGHPDLAGRKLGWLSAARPFPRTDEISDPLLEAVATHFAKQDDLLKKVVSFSGARVITIGEKTYAVISDRDEEMSKRAFPYPNISATIYVPITDLVNQLDDLREAAILSFIVMLLGIVIVRIVGSGVTKPVTRLADQANAISRLEVNQLEQLPHSFIQEVDDASMAFNRMVVALKWFERYVPKVLVSRLLQDGGADHLKTVKREATVLFTDLGGFTLLSETLSPEKVAEHLNEHFNVISEIIHKHGGMIDKYIGDSVMAVWSIPDEQEDHADRALQAALDIRHALEGILEQQKQVVRIGVHSGVLIAGNIGGFDRKNYTVVGDVVNVASRVEQLGKVHKNPESTVTILCSSSTAKRVTLESCSFGELGDIQIYGRKQTVTIYSV